MLQEQCSCGSTSTLQSAVCNYTIEAFSLLAYGHGYTVASSDDLSMDSDNPVSPRRPPQGGRTVRCRSHHRLLPPSSGSSLYLPTQWTPTPSALHFALFVGSDCYAPSVYHTMPLCTCGCSLWPCYSSSNREVAGLWVSTSLSLKNLSIVHKYNVNTFRKWPVSTLGARNDMKEMFNKL